MDDGEAKEAIDGAVRSAREQGKHVFVYVVAPWCPWCRRFEAFLGQEQVKAIMEKALVSAKTDIEEVRCPVLCRFQGCRQQHCVDASSISVPGLKKLEPAAEECIVGHVGG